MEIFVRDMERRDYDAVYRLVREPLGYSDIDRERFFVRLERLNSGIYRTLVAERDGAVVGFIGLCRLLGYEVDGEYIKITALAVDKICQGEGVGTALINAAEKFAAGEGISLIVVNSRATRTAAHEFYEHRGFFRYGYEFKRYLD